MRILLFVLLLFSSAIAHAQDDANQLNFYAWSGYLPDDIATKFEKETGIHINYTTFDSNETMYAKLKADPNTGYDLVVPSSYFIDRMAKQDMLLPLDKTKIQGIKNLNPDLMNKEYDPHNNYSLPYLWGTTAIVVNKKYIPPTSITSWNDLWNPKYYNQLLVLDDTRELFSVALILLGYSPNDTNPDHIKAAYEKLKLLMPNVKLFNDEAQQSIYIDEDATIGMGWSGEIYQAAQENPDITYVYPKEGFVIWIDNLAIPRGVKHLENAYKFINFILRPDVAAQLSTDIGYATPNSAGLKLLPADVQHNYIIYPDRATLHRGQVQTDVGSAAEIYEKYMELLKIGA